MGREMGGEVERGGVSDMIRYQDLVKRKKITPKAARALEAFTEDVMRYIYMYRSVCVCVCVWCVCVCVCV